MLKNIENFFDNYFSKFFSSNNKYYFIYYNKHFNFKKNILVDIKKSSYQNN